MRHKPERLAARRGRHCWRPHLKTFDDYELDETRFELRRRGLPVPLEPQVFEVLAYLVAHHGRVVPKDELIGHVWPGGFISDSALHTRVMAARKAIGDTGRDQRLIRTIRGRGFRFVGVVDERPDAPPPAAAMPAVGPPSSTHAAAPGLTPGLAVASTTFVGREPELARLGALLAYSGSRLVTLAGPGGIGKTRLAAECAARLRDSGVEVAEVALQPVQSAEGLRIAVAAALGLNLSDTSAAAIASRIGSRPTVLVLDNFEHLAEAGAPVLATLLAGASSLRILVTSREVIGLQEEWVVPVAGLAFATDGDDEPEAVRLFIEREAQAGVPSEAVDQSVREICRLVEGMPLAIELAASLRRYMTRDAIAASLRQGVDVLESSLRNVPERHRTMAGLLDEAFRHLTAPQLGTLLALSVFEDTFTLEDALQVTGTARRALLDLANRSLVQVREGEFALHSLLRQHARSRAGEGIERYRRSHAEHFASFLRSRRERLEWSDQAAASVEVEARLQNILAAWEWACDAGRLDLIDASVYPLFLYAQLRSRWGVVRPWVERAVEAVERAGEDGWPVLGFLVIFQVWARIRTSPGEQVAEAFARAEELYRSHRELPPPGPGTDTQAIRTLLYWGGGRYDRMATSAEEARQRAVDRGDLLGEAYALWLGAVARNRKAALCWSGTRRWRGAYAPASHADETTLREAQWFLDRATVLLSARGERAFRSNILHERAWNAKALGDVPMAIRLGRQCYDLRKEFDDRRGMADALLELTGSYLLNGEPDAARAACDEAEPILRRLGDPGGIAELERALALEAMSRGEADLALRRATRGADISLRIGSVNNVLGCLRLAADVLLDAGETATAAELHAFVAEHPASPPFSRALSEAALADESAALPAGSIAALRDRMRSEDLGDLTRSALARLPHVDTTA